MGDEWTAKKLIADLVGCRVGKLPPLDPGQFGVSDWQWLAVYGGTQDVRECMMGAWLRLGVKTTCPKCGRYAYHAFFLEGGKYPDAFECDYCRCLFGTAKKDLMELQARRSNLQYPPRLHETPSTRQLVQGIMRNTRENR